MKTELNKQAFAEALSTVAQAVGGRSTLPILENVLLEFSKTRLSCTATDLDIYLTGECECAGDAGQITLPAKRLLSIVKQLPTETLTIELSADHTATIKAGASRFKISGLDANDFPSKAVSKFEATDILLSGQDMTTLISRTAFAASNDESRYVLNGVLLTAADYQLSAVGTCGRRLAMQTISIPEGAAFEAIIPNKAVAFMARNVRKDGNVKLSIDENGLTVSTGSWVMQSKVIEGNYPNYKQVIPDKQAFLAKVERERLAGVLKRVGLMTTVMMPQSLFTFSPQELKVVAKDPNAGDAEEMLESQYDGDAVAISLNVHYMADILSALPHDVVEFGFNRSDQALTTRTDDGFLAVVMPMRTAN